MGSSAGALAFPHCSRFFGEFHQSRSPKRGLGLLSQSTLRNARSAERQRPTAGSAIGALLVFGLTNYCAVEELEFLTVDPSIIGSGNECDLTASVTI
jgi:hypothetical protein